MNALFTNSEFDLMKNMFNTNVFPYAVGEMVIEFGKYNDWVHACNLKDLYDYPSYRAFVVCKHDDGTYTYRTRFVHNNIDRYMRNNTIDWSKHSPYIYKSHKYNKVFNSLDDVLAHISKIIAKHPENYPTKK